MPSLSPTKLHMRRIGAAALFAMIFVAAPQVGKAAGCGAAKTQSPAPALKEPRLTALENTPVLAEERVALEHTKTKPPLRNPAERSKPCVMPLSSLDGSG